MAPSPDFLLVIFFTAILHVQAFSQDVHSAHTIYNSGVSELAKNPEKAYQLLEKAMRLSKENNDWDIYLKSVTKLGSFNLQNAEHRDEVFGWLKDAYQTVKDPHKNDDLAKLHYWIAEYYNRITIEIDTPIFHYKHALKIWTELKGETSQEVSNCYHGLGNIFKYYKFDFYEAEKCYEKALMIREKIGFDDQDALYKNYYSLAATNRSQFDFEKALSYGARTLEIAKNLGSYYSRAVTDRSQFEKAIAYNVTTLEEAKTLGIRRFELATGMVANIYRDMQQSDLAKTHYLTALRLNATTKDLESRAWYYLCLGENFKKDSLFTEALQHFNKAYVLYKNPAVKDQDLFLHLLTAMMETYSENNDDQNFGRIRKEIFGELSSLSKLQSESASLAWEEIGEHHFRKLNYDSALFCYQEGLKAAVKGFDSNDVSTNPSEGQIGFNYFISELLTKKASALKSKSLIDEDRALLGQSMDCLLLAERLVSLQRNSLDLEAAKWAFLDEQYDLYENILSTLHEGTAFFQKDTVHQLAFRYFEQSKARSLADALTQAEFSNQITAQDSLFRILNELKRQLFSTQDLINRELHATADSENLLKLRENIVQLDQKIQACKLAIEESHPGYFRAKYGYQNPSISEIQNLLREKRQVLIEFFWGNESVYAIGVGEKHVVFKKIGAVDSIASVVNNVLFHLHPDKSSMSVEAFDLYSTNAFKLYTILIEPFASLLTDINRIQIIPDGAIGQVPFEILLEGKAESKQVNYLALKYLIKSYAVGYAYSSSMLLDRESRRRSSHPSMLAVGFSGNQTFNGSSLKLRDIEGTEQELKALENRFESGRFLTDEDATEYNFKSIAPGFDIIHLAVHGMGDVQNDFAASLYFTSPASGDEDGELHAYELYGLKLKAFLAVLSSCESGLGRGYKGEGMISMASAFTYSGCENTLMSLWQVNDQASIELIDNFYSNLLDGESIDDALRKSKLSYLEKADELTADPKIWAPLVAYGTLDGLKLNDRSSIYLVAGGITILAILVLSFRRLKRSAS